MVLGRVIRKGPFSLTGWHIKVLKFKRNNLFWFIWFTNFQPLSMALDRQNGFSVKLIRFANTTRTDPSLRVQFFGHLDDFYAPEILNQQPVGKLTDTWTVGAIAYFMLDFPYYRLSLFQDFNFWLVCFECVCRSHSPAVEREELRSKGPNFQCLECCHENGTPSFELQMPIERHKTKKLKQCIIFIKRYENKNFELFINLNNCFQLLQKSHTDFQIQGKHFTTAIKFPWRAPKKFMTSWSTKMPTKIHRT